jgi:hypothetical protein
MRPFIFEDLAPSLQCRKIFFDCCGVLVRVIWALDRATFLT